MMWLIVFVVLYAAMLYLLVRPGSAGPQVVGDMASAVSGVVQTATGGNATSSGGQVLA